MVLISALCCFLPSFWQLVPAVLGSQLRAEPCQAELQNGTISTAELADSDHEGQHVILFQTLVSP